MSRSAGALAAAAQLAVAELAAAAIPGARGPVAGAVQQIIHTTPGPAVDAGVALAETADKALLKAGFVGASIAAGARATRDHDRHRRRLLRGRPHGADAAGRSHGHRRGRRSASRARPAA
jgi:hypothetical protein